MFEWGDMMLEGYKLRRCFLGGGGGTGCVEAGKIKRKYMKVNINVNRGFMFVVVN